MNRQSLRVVASLLLVVLVTLPLTGCSPEIRSLVYGYVLDLYHEKKEEMGAADTIAEVVLGRTGDDEADAAFDAYMAVEKIEKAEISANHAQERFDKEEYGAADNGLAVAMDLRPNDWTYVHKRMAWDFALNSVDGVDALSDKASGLMVAQDSDRVAFYTNAIDELWAVQSQVQNVPEATRAAYYAKLTAYYDFRSDAYSLAGDEQKAAEDTQRAIDLSDSP